MFLINRRSSSRLVPCQALFFGVGKNDSRLVGRLRSVSQPEFHELTQHECLVEAWNRNAIGHKTLRCRDLPLDQPLILELT